MENFRVIVHDSIYGTELPSIVASGTFIEEPTEQFLEEMIKESEGILCEVYIINENGNEKMDYTITL